jgi:hypothetical protein
MEAESATGMIFNICSFSSRPKENFQEFDALVFIVHIFFEFVDF